MKTPDPAPAGKPFLWFIFGASIVAFSIVVMHDVLTSPPDQLKRIAELIVLAVLYIIHKEYTRSLDSEKENNQ